MTALLISVMLAYSLLTGFVWYFQTKKPNQAYPLKIELALLGAVLIAHIGILLHPIMQEHALVIGFSSAVSLIIWLMLLLYWIGSCFNTLTGLQSLLYPIAALSLLVCIIFPGHQIEFPIDNWAFIGHVLTSFLAYGLFGIVTLLAIFILVLNRKLRKKNFLPLNQNTPSLLSLEKLMFQGMWIGFILLTYSVISGTIFAEQTFDKPAGLNHKILFGIISWLIYGVLLLKHSLTAWRGKKVAIWTIIGFVSLLLAYVGTKFMLEIILNR